MGADFPCLIVRQPFLLSGVRTNGVLWFPVFFVAR